MPPPFTAFPIPTVDIASTTSALDVSNSLVKSAGSTTARSLANRFAQWREPKDFGAVGNGATNDRTAIQATITAAGAGGNGGVVQLPPGIFATSDFLSITNSGVWIKGSGMGITTIKLTGVPADSLFKFFGGSVNCGISDLTIDQNNISNTQPSVFAQGFSSGFFTRNIAIINNAAKFGITVQLCDTFDVSDNYINRTTAINSENHAILVTAAGQNSNGRITRNTCINTNIEIDGQYMTVEDNNVSNWKYGGGITMGPSAFSHDNIVRDNICHGSRGEDADLTFPAGIELFTARTVIANNRCFDNSGNGIVFGGPNSTCTGNICYDNGQSAHGGDVSGILLQDGGGGGKADNSCVTGNACFNLNGVTQEFGIQVNNNVVGSIIWPNKLVGNNTAAYSALQTVAKLPSASAAGVGARSYVTDATVTTFASIVAGTGGNAVPVVSDGTNWRIG